MDQFTQGYICAVLSLVDGHGANTEAKELLRCIGKVKWVDLDPYDRAIFRKNGLRNEFYPKLKKD